MTKWIFIKQQWGLVKLRFTTQLEDAMLEALRRTVHRDPITDKKVSISVIIHTALYSVPEVRANYKAVLAERKQGEKTGDRRQRTRS